MRAVCDKELLLISSRNSHNKYNMCVCARAQNSDMGTIRSYKFNLILVLLITAQRIASITLFDCLGLLVERRHHGYQGYGVASDKTA